jgi:signal transduction histidine kinase
MMNVATFDDETVAGVVCRAKRGGKRRKLIPLCLVVTFVGAGRVNSLLGGISQASRRTTNCGHDIRARESNNNLLSQRNMRNGLFPGGHRSCYTRGSKAKKFDRIRVRRMSRPLDDGARPFPTMPSQQFLTLAQSQLELLASCLQQKGRVSPSSSSSSSKVKSIALYLPRENIRSGQLEFVPVVLHPDISAKRIWIAPESTSTALPFIPRTLPTLPGFTHASSLLPHYPFAAHVQQGENEQGQHIFSDNFQGSAGVGVVEEVTSKNMYSEERDGVLPLEDGNVLSVSLFKGSQTVGVLLVWPSTIGIQSAKSEFRASLSYTNQLSLVEQENMSTVSRFWSEDDRQQVSRAAYTLSVALSMDIETIAPQAAPQAPSIPISTIGVNALASYSSHNSNSFSSSIEKVGAAYAQLPENAYENLLRTQYLQTTEMRDSLADNLHQVKNPLQALRTFGKLLQRKLALEEFSDARSSGDSASLRDLAERMMSQTDRVIDLLEPMEDIVDRLDEVSRSSILALPSSTSVWQPSQEGDMAKSSKVKSVSASRAKSQTFEPAKERQMLPREAPVRRLNDNIKSITTSSPIVKCESDELVPRNGDSQGSRAPEGIHKSSKHPESTNNSPATSDDLQPSITSPPKQPILGDVEIEMAFVPDVIEPVLCAAEAVASELGIRFEVRDINEDDLPGVSLCPKSLQEALSNVLENAIKYVVAGKTEATISSEGGGRNYVDYNAGEGVPFIRVSVVPNPTDVGRGVSIIVEDNGPGIPESEREKIFERGFRGPRTVSLPGNGIGLDISRALLSRFQAKIEVLENGLDVPEGTVMRIMLFRELRRNAN